MTLPTPPPPVPDLREKLARTLHDLFLLPEADLTGVTSKSFDKTIWKPELGVAVDKILTLLPSPAVPDALTWTRAINFMRKWQHATCGLGLKNELVHSATCDEMAEILAALPEPRDPSQAPAPATKASNKWLIVACGFSACEAIGECMGHPAPAEKGGAAHA